MLWALTDCSSSRSFRLKNSNFLTITRKECQSINQIQFINTCGSRKSSENEWKNLIQIKKAIDGCGVLQCIVKACFSNFTWQKVYQLNALDGHRTWIGLNDFVLDFIEIDYYSYIHVFYPVSYDKVSLNGNILPLSDVIAFTHVKKLQCVTSKQVSLLLCLLVCFFSVARRFFSPSWSILS